MRDRAAQLNNPLANELINQSLVIVVGVTSDGALVFVSAGLVIVVAVVYARVVSARSPRAEPSRPSELRAEDSARSQARPKRVAAAVASARPRAEVAALEAVRAVAAVPGQVSREAVFAKCVAEKPGEGGEEERGGKESCVFRWTLKGRRVCVAVSAGAVV